MKKIKSAPSNIAEMVNKKKPIPNKKLFNNYKNQNYLFFIPIKQDRKTLIIKEKMNNLKNQKNIEKTFNNLMLDVINDNQINNLNNEESLVIGVLYFYISEKIFNKKNMKEFILYIIQILIRYLITLTLHETVINNKNLINHDLITNNMIINNNLFHGYIN